VAVAGPAVLRRQAASPPLAVGDALGAGDGVATGAGGRVRLLLHPAARLHLGPDSSLAIIRHGGAAGSDLRIEGSLVLDIPGAAGTVTIATGHAGIVAEAARVFVGRSRGEDAVFVERGRALVNAAGRSVNLGAGLGSVLAPGAPPGAPEPWQPARIAEALAAAGL
jgi:hypothetical protein